MDAPYKYRREPGYSRDRWAELLGMLERAREQGMPMELVRVPVVDGDQMVRALGPDDPLGPMVFADQSVVEAVVSDAPALVKHVDALHALLGRMCMMLDRLQGSRVAPRNNWPAFHELRDGASELLK